MRNGRGHRRKQVGRRRTGEGEKKEENTRIRRDERGKDRANDPLLNLCLSTIKVLPPITVPVSPQTTQ
jgi:hypothetical protein